MEPKGKDAAVRKGIALVKLGRNEEAVIVLSKSLKESPRDTLAWCYQGIALTALGQFENAVLAFDKTIEINRSMRPGILWQGKRTRQPGDVPGCSFIL